MNPISGGWTGEYSIDGYTAKASAKTPQSCVAKIQAKLIANKKKVDIPDIRYKLEMQWFQRDPSRFQRMPVKPGGPAPKGSGKSGLESSKVMAAVCGFLNLSYRVDMAPEDILPFMLEIFESKSVGCAQCVQIIRDVANDPPDDWRFEVQTRLLKHYGLPSKPKALIARSWQID